MAVDGQKLPFFLALLGHDCTTWPRIAGIPYGFSSCTVQYHSIAIPILGHHDLGRSWGKCHGFMMFHDVLCMFYVCVPLKIPSSRLLSCPVPVPVEALRPRAESK